MRLSKFVNKVWEIYIFRTKVGVNGSYSLKPCSAPDYIDICFVHHTIDMYMKE